MMLTFSLLLSPKTVADSMLLSFLAMKEVLTPSRMEKPVSVLTLPSWKLTSSNLECAALSLEAASSLLVFEASGSEGALHWLLWRQGSVH